MPFNISTLDALDFEVDEDYEEFHLFPESDFELHVDSYLCYCGPKLHKTVYGQDLYIHTAFKDGRH